MDPITAHILAKIYHNERKAEFERYWRYPPLNNPAEPGEPPRRRRIISWASLVLGALIGHISGVATRK